jgi:hypothetical protein
MVLSYRASFLILISEMVLAVAYIVLSGFSLRVSHVSLGFL